MARPSGTLTLNNSNVITQDAYGIWLVTADASVSDMKASNGALVRTSSPTYSSSGDLGPHFEGTGAGDVWVANALPTISGYPFVIGSIFSWTGTLPSGSNQYETAFSIGDNATSSGGRFVALIVDDGTMGFAGQIVGIWREVLTGTVNFVAGPTVVSGTEYAVAMRVFDIDNAWLRVNGTTYWRNVGSAAWDGAVDEVSMLSIRRAGTQLWPAASGMAVALGWYGNGTNISTADIETWGSDPWDMFVSDAAGGIPKTTKQTLLGVG